jgi:hypothetical protein
MKISTVAFLFSAAAVGSGRDVMAQACLGYPSFEAGRVRLGASVAASENALSFAGGLTLGSGRPFGGISLGVTNFDNIEGRALVVGGGAGYQLTRSPSAAVQGCLGASGTLGSGPHNVTGSGENAFSYTFLIGAAMGVALGGNAAQKIVPTVGIGFAGSRFQASRRVLWTSVFDHSEKFWLVDLGVGFLVSPVLAFRPSVSVPLGWEAAQPVYALSAALNIGRRR